MPTPSSARDAPAAAPEPFFFRTRNLRESENRAHSREGATERGFKGPIVGGAIVYGQMIRPLVERYGRAWLERSRIDVRFKAPAYDDDLVDARYQVVEEAPGTGGGAPSRCIVARAHNLEGTELIELRARLRERDAVPEPDPLASLEPAEPQPGEDERVEGTWERMAVGRPFRAYRFRVTAQEQQEYCHATGDDLPLYLRGPRPLAHPGLVMAQGSRVVANHFLMPFWIHASSTLEHRREIRVGDTIELRCVPIDKWKRGESEWVRFYQVYLAGGEPAIEVWKTSVIKVAPR